MSGPRRSCARNGRDIEEMDRTINQFLDFARTDGGEPMQSADLARIAAEVAEHYRRRGKSIATIFRTCPGCRSADVDAARGDEPDRQRAALREKGVSVACAPRTA